VVEFPAILEVKDNKTGKYVEKPLWPEFFDLEALLRTKASMPNFQWNAQYQQQPTAEEASIVKREWWNIWDLDSAPLCEYVIMSLDAAAETHNRADYTALTTWGVFLNEETEAYNIILLNSIKKRLEFPELKRAAYDKYQEFEPDQMIVEKKASGAPLIFELRAMGIPVTEFTPSRGQDKIARVNAVTDLFASGSIWYLPTRWSEEVIEECASFPSGDHDDLVDSTTQALLRFRQGGWVRAEMDDWDDEPKYQRPVEYY
jgi:predicted phage terminase large subunit-like protein